MSPWSELLALSAKEGDGRRARAEVRVLVRSVRHVTRRVWLRWGAGAVDVREVDWIGGCTVVDLWLEALVYRKNAGNFDPIQFFIWDGEKMVFGRVVVGWGLVFSVEELGGEGA